MAEYQTVVYCSSSKDDALVKSIEMAKEKVSYSRFSDWPGLKYYIWYVKSLAKH